MKRSGVVAAIVVLAAVPAAAETAAPAGAASCSGCHAPASRPGALVPPLVGRAPGDIVAAMRAFRTGERSATVMDRIARGFSEDETAAIAAWLAERHGGRP